MAEQETRWHKKYRETTIKLLGRVFWDNTTYRRTHTASEWREFYLDYCKREHPERVEGILDGTTKL